MTTQTSIERAREEFLVLMGKTTGPTRFTEPRCAEEQADGVCKCPETTHTIDNRFSDPGITRTVCVPPPEFGAPKRDGSVWLKPFAATPAKPCVIPKRTIENMAASSALGLAYWSEAPGANKIYAVDDDGHAHTLLLDRKNRKVEHYCAQTWRYDPVTQGPRYETKKRCPATNVRDVDWAMPDDDRGVMMLNWTIEDQAEAENPGSAERDPGRLGRTGHCLSNQHHRCGYRVGGPLENGVTSSVTGLHYRCPCPCHTTEETEENEMPTARDNRPAAVKKAAQANNRLKATHVTAAEKRAAKAAREKREAQRDAELAEIAAKAEAEARAKYAAQDKAEAEALVRAATPKPMSRAQAKSLLLHDPDYLGDITNDALVDLLDDESVKPYHARIRTELRVNRGLTQRRSA